MNYRFNDLAQLRQEIAIAAARMIAEEGTSYDAAKRKAARLLLGNSRITGEILPDNQTIENEVLNGTGGEHSDIYLQIFADNVKDIEIFLLNEGIEFSVSESPQSPGKRHANEVIHFLWHDEVIHLTVYDADDIC